MAPLKSPSMCQVRLGIVVRLKTEETPLIAQDDLVETLEDTPILIDVTQNDYGEAKQLTVSLGSIKPSHGSVKLQDNQLFYTPDPNFNGFDQMSYHVKDIHEQSKTAMVIIQVVAVNDAPSSGGDYAVFFSGKKLFSFQLRGSDIESSDLTFTITRPPSEGLIFAQSTSQVIFLL